MPELTITRRSGAQHKIRFDEADAAVVLSRRWRISPSPSGTVLYAITTVGHTTVSLHRLLTGWASVDHVNHDGLDNRRANLRPADARENGGNRRPVEGTSSRFRGVTLHRKTGRWQAALAGRYLGLYDTEEAAAAAFDVAAAAEYGEFAYQNLATA